MHLCSMKQMSIFLGAALLLLIIACQSPTGAPAVEATAKPATKLQGTGDSASIALATKVMEANGGQQAWEDTRYIRWNFFGSRIHTWDKQTDDLVIKGIKDNFDIKMNLRTNKGTVNYAGVEYVQPDTLKKYIGLGRDMWNNDSYWLLMPFKLRDPGVNLKYLGETPFRGLPNVHQIEMTFESVGSTPENRYIIFIHPETYRVVQWQFFPTRNDPEPRFATSWSNYQQFGNIWLSDNRGENYKLTDIAVDDPELKKYFE